MERNLVGSERERTRPRCEKKTSKSRQKEPAFLIGPRTRDLNEKSEKDERGERGRLTLRPRQCEGEVLRYTDVQTTQLPKEQQRLLAKIGQPREGAGKTIVNNSLPVDRERARKDKELKRFRASSKAVRPFKSKLKGGGVHSPRHQHMEELA